MKEREGEGGLWENEGRSERERWRDEMHLKDNCWFGSIVDFRMFLLGVKKYSLILCC